MIVTLRCPVRGCAERLDSQGRSFACARGHSFDLRRTGSLNLLQSQDRRSRHPGDSREAALARRRLAEAGQADSLYRAFARIIESRSEGQPESLLDVGCGEGGLLRHLGRLKGLEKHGLDISAPAIDLAVRASPENLFVVANADRLLPYADRSFDFVTSIDARINAGEFARILKSRGLVLVAVPAADDLIELRESVQGGTVHKAKAVRIEEGLATSLTLLDRVTVRERQTFDPKTLRDLLTTSYRGFRRSERPAVDSLAEMHVTLSHEILVFEHKGARAPRLRP